MENRRVGALGANLNNLLTLLCDLGSSYLQATCLSDGVIDGSAVSTRGSPAWCALTPTRKALGFPQVTTPFPTSRPRALLLTPFSSGSHSLPSGPHCRSAVCSRGAPGQACGAGLLHRPPCHIGGHRTARPTADDVERDRLAEVAPARSLHSRVPCSLCKVRVTLSPEYPSPSGVYTH